MPKAAPAEPPQEEGKPIKRRPGINAQDQAKIAQISSKFPHFGPSSILDEWRTGEDDDGKRWCDDY